jgi:hypothetical protein
VSLLAACVLLLVTAFLFGSAVYILSRDPFERVNQSYCLLALSQVAYVGSLFVFTATAPGAALLWIGRINFAAAALVAPAVLLLVHSLLNRRHRYPWLLLLETTVVAGVALFTGLVDKAETITGGVHTTTYGPLVLLYFIHLVAYLAVGIYSALTPAANVPRLQRRQVLIVGYGLLVTAAIGITTNVVLPYIYGDFRYIAYGGLATVVSLATISYASLVYKLFNLRLVVRAAFTYGAIIAVMLELYSLAVDALTKLLPLSSPDERRAAAAVVAFVINAFTQEPIKVWLEELADRLSKRHKWHRATRN